MMVLHEHIHIISLQNLIYVYMYTCFVLYSFYEECIIVYKVLLHIRCNDSVCGLCMDRVSIPTNFHFEIIVMKKKED